MDHPDPLECVKNCMVTHNWQRAKCDVAIVGIIDNRQTDKLFPVINYSNFEYAFPKRQFHYTDVIMIAVVSQITSLAIVYSLVYSGADQRKHQSSGSLAFVWGIHRSPVNSSHKRPATRKMFLFDDVIMS